MPIPPVPPFRFVCVFECEPSGGLYDTTELMVYHPHAGVNDLSVYSGFKRRPLTPWSYEMSCDVMGGGGVSVCLLKPGRGLWWMFSLYQ